MPTAYTSPTFLRRGVVAGLVLFMQHTAVYDDVMGAWTDGFGDGHPTTPSTPRNVAMAAPGIGLGVLFAQSTMWRPATAPTVPDITTAGRHFLCYNTTHG